MPFRKLLRHTILYILCMIFLSACGDNNTLAVEGMNSTSQKDMIKSNTSRTNKGYPTVLKITRCLFLGDTNDNRDMKEEFVKIFFQKTGIKLEVIYPPRINYMEKVNLMIASGELDGMVNFFSPSHVFNAVKEDTIELLDGYLKNNKNWNSMPEEYRNCYMLNGKLYAIPAGYESGFFTRSFRKDWLDNLKLDIPETVDELFEVARAFTEDDPDCNGINDTIGLTSSKFWNLQDIFQAFDAMLNNTGEIPISWDPITDAWQDSMLKPEMADALAYIKKLYDYGYLDRNFLTNEGSNMRESLWTGKSGSTFYWAMHAYRQATFEMKNKEPEAVWVEIPAIKGKRTQLLNNRVMGGLIYTLVKGTKQPEETINTFVNALFDKETFLMLRYGIEGKTYRKEGDHIVILRDPDTGQPYETSGLVAEMPQFNKFKIPYCYDGSQEDIDYSLDLIKTENRLMEKGLKENLLFNVVGSAYDSPVSDEFSQRSTDIKKIFEKEACKAIFGEKTIEQALKDYRIKMKRLGGDRILEEANASIGKKPQQRY